MPTKGVKSARTGTKTIIKRVKGEMTERAVVAACIIGQGAAALMTPVDTSALINSQYRKLEKHNDGWIGSVGYTMAYAASVHGASGKLKGKPRQHFGKTKDGVEFGGGTGVGNYWDPSGEPEFLRKGFDDNLDAIREVIRQEHKL